MNIMSLVNAIPGTVAQGLIWGIMAIGVYITFRILDIADLTVDGSQYALAQKEGVTGFYKAEAGSVIAAGKAYIVARAAGTKGFTLNFPGETGIESVEKAAEGSEIYDLAGRRVVKALKGVYIINGKKVLK